MPHHKSCKKRMRQSEKRRQRNKVTRHELRSAIRELREGEGADDIAGKYRQVSSMLDKAASNGLIHSKAADRHKARLAKLLQSPA